MRKFTLKYSCLSLILFSFFFTNVILADSSFVQRKEVQEFINKMVKEHRFNKRGLIQAMEEVQLQTQVIESMEKPSEKKPWDIYKQIFLTTERVNQGLVFWRENRKALEKAEKQYGVPANMIVAIIGVETFYGKNQGQYRVIDALSTLAFNYPKRSNYFLKELAEYFLLCREHEVKPNQYFGSYAGAMGKPQFMPSSYRHYATDFSNKKKKDLMNDNDAVIASVANYFHHHGWKTLAEVAKPTQKKQKSSQISEPNTLELINQNGNSEYWTVYPNFYVITRYNTNPQYAMAVFLLSQQLKQEWAALNNTSQKKAYA